MTGFVGKQRGRIGGGAGSKVESTSHTCMEGVFDLGTHLIYFVSWTTSSTLVHVQVYVTNERAHHASVFEHT